MAMAAPSAHAQTERRKPAAAMTSGRAMKGPTPIISSMLKRTAERRPMRRSSPPESPAPESAVSAFCPVERPAGFETNGALGCPLSRLLVRISRRPSKIVPPVS